MSEKYPLATRRAYNDIAERVREKEKERRCLVRVTYKDKAFRFSMIVGCGKHSIINNYTFSLFGLNYQPR